MRLPIYSLAYLLLVLSVAGCIEQEQEPTETAAQEIEPVDEQAEEAPSQIRTQQDDRSVAARLEDRTTGARVELALADAAGLSAYAFDAAVSDGRVLLQGDVRTRDEYERAARVAREIDGISEVINQVTIGGEAVVAAEPEPDPDTAEASPALAERDTAADEGETDKQPASEPLENQQQEETTYHTVQSGQSLWTISRRYDVSIDQIRRLNDLQGSNIQPGDRLRVK